MPCGRPARNRCLGAGSAWSSAEMFGSALCRAPASAAHSGVVLAMIRRHLTVCGRFADLPRLLALILRADHAPLGESRCSAPRTGSGPTNAPRLLRRGLLGEAPATSLLICPHPRMRQSRPTTLPARSDAAPPYLPQNPVTPFSNYFFPDSKALTSQPHPVPPVHKLRSN